MLSLLLVARRDNSSVSITADSHISIFRNAVHDGRCPDGNDCRLVCCALELTGRNAERSSTDHDDADQDACNEKLCEGEAF